MSRKNRIIFSGAIYHIYQRGNNKEFIFDNPKHKGFLIKQIKESNRIYDFQLLAYVIMGNHYHLLVKANETPISHIMFSINNVLGKYLNRELDRTGHVFEGRYGCKLVDDTAYLIWLLRYIHRNPVRAGICNTIEEYRWSSHYLYKYGINKFVNTNFILKVLSENKMEAIKEYKRLVGIKEAQSEKEDYQRVKTELKINNSIVKYEEDKVFIRDVKSLSNILDLMDIKADIKELLKSGSRKHSITTYKIRFIEEAIKNKHTLKEIGKFLNTSQSAISNILAYHRGDSHV